MASYLLLETGDKIILEDGTGFILLETQNITGVGILLADAATLDGVGTVTGAGTPGNGRKHRLLLDPEPITHRQ